MVTQLIQTLSGSRDREGAEGVREQESIPVFIQTSALTPQSLISDRNAAIQQLLTVLLRENYS